MQKILRFFSKDKPIEVTHSSQLDEMMSRGRAFQLDGRSKQALEIYHSILEADPSYWEALSGVAEIASHEGRPEDAIVLYDDFIERHRGHSKANYKRANVLNRLGRFDAALDGYEKAIESDPAYGVAYCNRGTVLAHLGRWNDALASYDKAGALDPDDAVVFYNRAAALKELGRFEEALGDYDRAIALNVDYIEAYVNRAHLLRRAGKTAPALASYDEAIRRNPGYPEAFEGRGSCLCQLQRYDEALISHDRAIQLKQDYAVAYIGRGNALKLLKRLDLAMESYAKAIELEPFQAEAFEGYGFCLFSHGLIEAAIRCYNRALELEPDRRFLLGLRRHAQMHICEWQGLKEDLQRIVDGLSAKAAIVQPFIFSALLDSPRLQRVAAEIWARDECPPDDALGIIPRREQGSKIRVGYFSADFRAHPVALLTAELFETHDRSRFEIFAFACSPDSQDPIRQRLRGAFDQFIDVYGQSDAEISTLARKMGIDIAVDLGGFTAHSRTGIFALRAAPIQLSYIGYLGTMGAAYMDYLIADTTIVPAEYRQHYSEKIIFMPSYQVNDTARKASDKTFAREELGLPAEGFVFCCFNATYKLTPATFEIWMRILHRVESSCLYLYVDNSVAQLNLTKQVELHGLDPTRIVFGERVPLDHYLSRFRAMDLFLDTAPYNAGATASDALWAGLPVLTCLGQAFASRYAASLLKAVELPELVTTTIEAYEDLAVRLATSPTELASIRERLEKNRGTVPLFNTSAFTKNLESAYVSAYERWRSNLPPEDIYPSS